MAIEKNGEFAVVRDDMQGVHRIIDTASAVRSKVAAIMAEDDAYIAGIGEIQAMSITAQAEKHLDANISRLSRLADEKVDTVCHAEQRLLAEQERLRAEIEREKRAVTECGNRVDSLASHLNGKRRQLLQLEHDMDVAEQRRVEEMQAMVARNEELQLRMAMVSAAGAHGDDSLDSQVHSVMEQFNVAFGAKTAAVPVMQVPSDLVDD
ncbi:hypothetical protein J8273_0583 [Carpediemonas membranifera]|uniref:Uncharacterized protein n=1 Tax=Carpediemonas membranifera TaxID=201153 RepID=A0A8J6B947_9EUKA|nr:hypothetical protein J8273_0583 [Carpediemonas membranifera]|eukprot:KAG9395342.1 hypothetical protein J8273_0583 [Carpediemonas membranifera]